MEVSGCAVQVHILYRCSFHDAQVAARILLTSDEMSPFLARALVDSAAAGARMQKQRSTHSSSSSSGAEVAANRPPGGVESNLFSSGFSAVVENAVSAQEREASPSHSDSSPLTLYDYLVDVIGEGLTMSLSATTTPEGQRDSTTKLLSSKLEPPKPDAAMKANLSLEEFLSREGFQPIRVQLPHRAAPPPSIPRGYYRGREPWTFNIPQPLLPTRTNILDQMHSHRDTPHGHATPPILKGRCRSHHRYYRQKDSVNIASYWV